MTENELDNIFKSKLSGNIHPYNEASWQKAESAIDEASVNDAQLDLLFKDKLASNNHPYNPGSWVKMEKLIESSAGLTVKQKLISTLAVAASLLAILSVTFFYANKNNDKSQLVEHEQHAENSEENNGVNEAGMKTDLLNLEKAEIALKNKPENTDKSEKNRKNKAKNNQVKNVKSSKKAERKAANSSEKNQEKKEKNQKKAKKKSKTYFEDNLSVIPGKKAPNNTFIFDEDEAEIRTEFNSEINEEADYVELLDLKEFEVSSKSEIANKYLEISKSRKWYIELNAGINLARPYNNGTSNNIDLSPQHLVGISLNRNFNNKFNLETGLLYFSRLAQNTQLDFTQLRYSFGYEEVNTNINPVSIHYLGIPLIINYSIGSRNYVGLGVQAAYLMNSFSNIEVSQSQSLQQSQKANAKEWGYLGGFNRFDAAVMLNYHHLITDRIKVGLSANYGLIDVTKNGVHKNNFDDRNLQMMVRMRYRVFDF